MCRGCLDVIPKCEIVAQHLVSGEGESNSTSSAAGGALLKISVATVV